MAKAFKKISLLEFSIYGRRIINSLVSKSYLNFLIDRELLAQFYRFAVKNEEFKNFARFKLQITPQAAAELLSEMKVLPNDNRIIRMFKQWRDDVDNQEKVRQARLKVLADLKRYLVKD